MPAVAQLLAGSEWADIMGMGGHGVSLTTPAGAASSAYSASAILEAAKAVKAAPPLSPIAWASLMVRYATYISVKSSDFALI